MIISPTINANLNGIAIIKYPIANGINVQTIRNDSLKYFSQIFLIANAWLIEIIIPINAIKSPEAITVQEKIFPIYNAKIELFSEIAIPKNNQEIYSGKIFLFFKALIIGENGFKESFLCFFRGEFQAKRNMRELCL